MSKSRKYCAVDGCKSQQTNENLSFFSLPSDEERRKKWLDVIGRPDLLTTRTKPASHIVCSLHFQKTMIKNKPQLRADAVPTEMLPNRPSTSDQNTNEDLKDASTQTIESYNNILSAVAIKGSDTKSLCVQPTSDDIQNIATQTSVSVSSAAPRKLRSESQDSDLERRKLQNELNKICIYIPTYEDMTDSKCLMAEPTDVPDNARSLDTAVKSGPAHVDDHLGEDGVYTVKLEVEIGPEVLQPPDLQYMPLPCKPEPADGPAPNKTERTHQCDLCEKRYRTAQALAVHRKMHTSDRTYECDHCGKTYKTRTQINVHMQSHTLKFKCNVCGKRLPHRASLKMHALAHLDPSHRPHECMECHKRFIDSYKLLVHTRQHRGEKPFQCEICLTKYVCKEELTRHVKKHHTDGGDAKNKVRKPRTKSLFRNERIFQGKPQKCLLIKRKTKVKVPSVVSDKFQCNICGKRFSANQQLKCHYNKHSNERPIKCDECDKTFKYKTQLYAHKLGHSGDKPHQCTTCGARFALKTILNTHLKSHSSEKPFKCDECDLTFKYNSGLWMHKLIHKGEKPHQCTVCGSRFTLKGNLTGHMKTHTNEKPFECTLCGRKFPWRRNLRNHQKTHAKEQKALDLQ